MSNPNRAIAIQLQEPCFRESSARLNRNQVGSKSQVSYAYYLPVAFGSLAAWNSAAILPNLIYQEIAHLLVISFGSSNTVNDNACL